MKSVANKENFSLVYFITRSLFLGLAFSNFFNQSGSDSIIACFLGTLLGIFLIWIINKMKYSQDNFKLIQLIIYFFLLIIAVMVLETFIGSFFLTSTPKLIIIAPTISLCLYTAVKKTSTIRRTSFLLIFFSLAIFGIAAISLSSFFTWDNITPLFIHKTSNIFKSALIFASLSASPQLLLKRENIPLNKHIKYYITACITHILVCIVCLGVLTPNVAKIYSFPEYMVLKRIKLFTFIENIENFLSSIWYVDMFVFITIILKRIYEILKNKIMYFPLVIISVLFTTYFIVDNYYRVMILYQYTPYILLGMIALMGFSALKKS